MSLAAAGAQAGPHVHITAGQAAFLLISVGLAGGWFLVLWVISRATRQPPVHAQPATSDLGPEPPAVAGMLAHGCRVGVEAAAATLLDLAARHVVDLEEVGPQLSLCRIRRRGGEGLAPYERRILSYLEALASGDVVPAQALAQGAAMPAGWWRRFRNEVIAAARDGGLSRPRWSMSLVAGLALLAGLPGASLGFAFGGNEAGGAIGAVLLGYALVSRLNADRLTASGAAAAGRWLGVRAHLAADRALASQPPAAVTVYGRHLAYGAAFGVARTAIESLPIGQPASARSAWSTYGTGMWHKVDITYSGRASWGHAPGGIVFWRLLRAAVLTGAGWFVLTVIPEILTSLQAASGPFAGPHSGRGVVHVAQIVIPVAGWLALALAATALFGALRAFADLFGAGPAEGEVVRTRVVVIRRNESGQPTSSEYWIAVDDGTAPTVRAWRVGYAIFRQVNETDVIRVRVTRIFRHVSQLQMIADRPQVNVEAGLPAEQRVGEGADLSAAVLAGVTALSGGSSPGLDPAALVTAEDAATLLGGPANAAQVLDPLEHIPNAASNPVARIATLAACRWAAADGSGHSADVFFGAGLGARSLIGVLIASTRKTAKAERRRLGQGAVIAGNMLALSRDGKTAAVVLNGADPQAASTVLERFLPILANRIETGAQLAGQPHAFPSHTDPAR